MIAIIILSILICVCLYVIWNLLRKIETVEEAYRDATTTNILLYETLQDTYIEMNKIDDSGIFKSDDEVGAIFSQLRDTLTIASAALQGDDNE